MGAKESVYYTSVEKRQCYCPSGDGARLQNPEHKQYGSLEVVSACTLGGLQVRCA